MARQHVSFVVTKALAFTTQCSAVKVARCATQDLLTVLLLVCLGSVISISSCCDYCMFDDQICLHRMLLNTSAISCMMYTVVHKKTRYFYFFDNSGKY